MKSYREDSKKKRVGGAMHREKGRQMVVAELWKEECRRTP